MRRFSRVILGMVLAIVAAGSAGAQTTWTTTSGAWNSPASWSNGVPTETTAAVFTGSTALTGTIANGVSGSAASIAFTNTNGRITISIVDGGRLNVGGAITDTGAGQVTFSVANTNQANAASILTATAITADNFDLTGGGSQFLTMNSNIVTKTQLSIGNPSGTTVYRQVGGTLEAQGGGYGLTLMEGSSLTSTGTASFVLDGGRVMAERIGVGNTNGNNGTVPRYVNNGSFVFNSGTVGPRSSVNLMFANGSGRTSGTSLDTQLDTNRPLTIALAATGTHEFNAAGAHIFVTPSAQVRNQAGQAGTLLKTGTGIMYFTGNGPVAVNDWSGASTVAAGTLAVDFNQIAGTATSGSTTALANGYSQSSQLVLDGGDFALTGRPNATGTSIANLSMNAGGYTLTVPSTTGLVVGQAVTSGTNLPAGTYIRRILSPTSVELNAMLTGTVNLSGQAFNFAAANFTNSQAVNSVSLLKTGTVTVNPAGNSTLLTFGTVSGTAGFVKAGTGTLRLDGPLSYSGTTSLQGGMLEVTGITGTTTLTSPFVGSSGTFRYASPGTLVLSTTSVGQSTFSGGVIVDSGVLQMGLNDSLQYRGFNSVPSVVVNAGGRLAVTRDNMGTPAITLNGGTLSTGTVGGSGGAFQPLGAITMNAGSMITGPGMGGIFQAFALSGTVTVSGSGASAMSAGAGSNNGIHLAYNASGTPERTFIVADATSDASADLTVSASLLNSSHTGTAAALVKAGLGTMRLSGSNAYTGATTIGAGTLEFTTVNALRNSSAVNVAAGGVLAYSGTAATFDRNVTITGGTGTILHAGSGPLTLSGTLTKDGTVLRLAGGSFNVTGRIVGASANSDLVVNGTSSVTLSAANSYNGPTFVNQASQLTVGVNNAIPGGSVVTLGDATTSGTLSLGTLSNAVGGLAFGAGGGAVRLQAASTAAAQLSAASGTLALAGGSLDLAGSGTAAGLYRLLSASTITGSFASVTGASPAYQLVSTSTSIDYQQRAVLGGITVTNPTAAIVTGGSAAFTYSVANAALAGGAGLSFAGAGTSGVAGSTSGSALAAGSSGAVAGLVYTGTAIGASQTGLFSVSAPTAYGATTATGTVAVTVLDHATASLASLLATSSTLSFGTWNYATQSWDEGGNTAVFSIFNLASSFGNSLTADLSLVNLEQTGDSGFTTNLNTFTDVAGGQSRSYSVYFDPTGLTGPTTRSAVFTLSTSDKTGLSGAAASNTLTVTANVVVVPEPTAIVLVGIGMAGLGAAAWRRRARRRP